MHKQDVKNRISGHSSLVAFWDFQEPAGELRQAQGPYGYVLSEQEGPIERAEEGVFGPYSAKLRFGQWLNLPRAACPALDFHGKDTALTIIAWVKREQRDNRECQAVAGMWNETDKKRQYCLFLDLHIWESADQVCGHVSSTGGPTPGHPWCMTTAIGATPVAQGEWHTVAFTYDGAYARTYLDGRLDVRETYNPYAYPEGLYAGGAAGADFTVGAVYRSGAMGNFFAGHLGGLAVFNRALGDDELAQLV
ncbi:LamG domain-containing protein [Paenibacillus ferrarius]|uniref:LamG domain-containing protein n=1 Tax=Paenibacillus ferrarius TaxID=1469647 RepID=UPI003D2A734C